MTLTIKIKLRRCRFTRLGTRRAGVKLIVGVVVLPKEIRTRHYRAVICRVSRHCARSLGITLRKVGHDFCLIGVSITPANRDINDTKIY